MVPAMGRRDRLIRRPGWRQIKFGDVRFDEVRKEQVREHCQFPGLSFFLIDDEVNDFSESGVSVLVIAL